MIPIVVWSLWIALLSPPSWIGWYPTTTTSPPWWHPLPSPLPLAGTLLPPLHHQLAPYCYPLSFGFRRTSMVTFQVPHTLYGYVTAADWGSALCCSALPVMARDLSSHLVLHAGALGLPIGLAFWAPCGARRLRLMGGMSSELWSFLMLFRMLFCWFTVAWGFLYVACLWRFFGSSVHRSGWLSGFVFSPSCR